MLQLDIDQYQVGWICALPSEYAAAKAMLDEQHRMVSGQDRADSNSYTLGRVHEHNVVIACLPAGVDGTNAAAIVATNLSRTFRSIRFGLMVGIGGGIPDLHNNRDVRLGDVVVSQPSGRNGGVVQYDKGKSHDGGRFEFKGLLNKPPAVLLTALQNLRAEHEIDDSQITKYLEQMIQRRPKMQERGYSFPAQENDVLQCTHSTKASTSCENCEDGKVKRVPRQSTEPVIHYGVIACGNQVIKSAVHRDQLRDECDSAICVEMEAAGLMDEFPCLVIRGICDYADSLKNDKWHNYAAATAAAFAKELLSYVSVEQASHERPIQEILGFLPEAREYFRDQKEHNEQQQAYNRQQEMYTLRQEIRELPVVAQAIYGSRDGIHEQCHPDTRVDLLSSIWDWLRDTEGKGIFWLNGVAGTGKSTISSTVAKRLLDAENDRSVLGASFFFKRGEGERASAALLFPTIAMQLAMKIPNFDLCLAQALRDNPQICTKALGEQFRRLISGPLQQLDGGSHFTYVVVLDALDECEKEDDIQTILRLWQTLTAKTSKLRLRLFLTSRPELAIRLSFKEMPTTIHHDLILHQIPRRILRHDIHAFLTTKLSEARRKHNLLLDDSLVDEQLTEDWPGSEKLQKLTDIAMPLFIVATTIYRLIRDSRDPRHRLQTILQSENAIGLSEVGSIYTLVLQAMTSLFREAADVAQVHHDFRVIVGTIVTLIEPLSRISLSALLQIRPSEVQLGLRSLHAVLEIPSDDHGIIRPLHLSFGEYLSSPEVQQTPYWIDRKATHGILWRRCIQVLSRSTGLRENICDLEYPGQLRSTISLARIEQVLQPELRYACDYWVYHVQHSGQCPRDGDEVHLFLTKHFLHWLEALSLMNQISKAVSTIDMLKSCVSQISNLYAFLEDARRFVLAHRYVIDLAPLQLYSSAILFSPENSLVRKIRGQEARDQVPCWIRQYPRTTVEWGSELEKLEGHSDRVWSVAFSPDGSLLASGSDDRTVRLWDTQTGREVQKLKEHSDRVWSVAFSPDGSLLASVPHYGTLRLWETQTGREVYKLERQSSFISLVTFSPSSSLLALGSHRTVQLWNLQTGREIQNLEGHSKDVYSVAFSPDGSLLASGSRDQTVRLWETWRGKEIYKLKGHSSFISSVAFSPDSSLLASGSDDRTIRLWETQTGREVQKLEGHSNSVHSVAFSPDGSLLASASTDRTVRMWDTQTRREVQKLERHSSFVWKVVFSPDGSLLASGSGDGTVRLWDTQTGRGVHKLEGHSDSKTVFPGNSVHSIAFSPNGSLLASGSDDGMVRLWDTQTWREVRKLEGHFGFIYSITFSPDGSLLVSVSEDWTMRLWDTQTEKEVRIYEGHAGGVYSAVFSPDGSLLASVSRDRTVRLWDTQTGKEVQKLETNSDHVYSLTFSLDGTALILDYEMYDLSDSIGLNTEIVRSTRDSRISVIGDWIRVGGQDFLWLPEEYRGRISTTYNDKLAIGSNSGLVSIFQLGPC